MSCYHPLHAFDVGNKTAEGKIKYQIEAENVSWVRNKKGFKVSNFIEIPCGKCIGCRLEYSRQWAVRCMLESKYHTDNYFLTLTYDEMNLPLVKGVADDGVIEYVGTLQPKHLQDFLKRLRIYYKRHYDIDDIRFFACGEYGDKYHRPHYHVIIFGLPIPDLKYFTTNRKSNEVCYRSELLEKLWTHGIVGVGNVSFESCAYVARYVVKKRKGKDAAYYKAHGIEPEFVRMSRRPGIASKFYDENKDRIYECDEIIVPRKDGPQKCKPSRYFDSKFDLEEPDLLAEIKKRRQECAKEALKDKLMRTSLNEEDYRKLMENEKLTQAQKLVRNMH